MSQEITQTQVEDTARLLSPNERRAIQALGNWAHTEAPLSFFVSEADFGSYDEAYSANSWLQKKGLVQISETPSRSVRLGPEGKKFLEGFPEERVWNYVSTKAKPVPLSEIIGKFGRDDTEIALAWWKRKGLGSIERGPTEMILAASPSPPNHGDFTALKELAKRADSPVLEAEFAERHPKGFELLRKRPGVVEVSTTKIRFVRLTPLGQAVCKSPTLGKLELVGELTPEQIKTGQWKGKELRGYDVSTPVPRVFTGKPHPLMQIIEEVRMIFLELGFQEIEEDFVQSAFWNLDALFIPQDHPAREMQDTFYLQVPPTVPVEADLVERISKVHESGGGTGSRGWGAPLDPDESHRALLRTHTTVGTIKYLAKNPQGPTRVFSVGRVFRKEKMDATHLPEFHQIEGIATEPGADFRMLLGILQEFYRRLGFEKLRWRPAYFPYTEPSMEVEVWTGKKWMELGGCGIFRAEVTEPFGVKTPVLAWGLGLERLAMLRLGLSDIRDLYISDLEWLRNQPLL